MNIRARLVRSVALAGAVIMASLLVGSPAYGTTTTTTVEIRGGSDGILVGKAVFTRSIDTVGNESLTVNLSVPTGIDEAHFCVSDTAFTSRASPGKCPYQHQPTGTTAHLVIPLGTAHIGEPVYTQTSVVTDDTTAFAGWVAGKPFYGNIQVAAVVGTVEATTGHAAGSLPLAVVLTGALVLLIGSSYRGARTGRVSFKS